MLTDPRSPMADPARLPPSLWAASSGDAPVAAEPLDGERTFDIAVIGGGFTGLSTAIHAARAGASVCVLEAAEVGWGASGRNGGQVIAGLKYHPDKVERDFGAERGGRMVEMSARGPDMVFDLIERYGIRCAPVRNGWLQAIHSTAVQDESRKLVEQWHKRGEDVEMLDAAEAERLIGAAGYVGALIDRRSGALQPLAYVRGLARAAQQEGATLFERAEVTAIERANDGYKLRTQRGSVAAGKVVIATNAYGDDIHGRLGRSYFPINSFIVATAPLSENVRRSILPEGHVVSDTRKFLLYFRLDADGRLVVGGRGAYRDPVGPEPFIHVEWALARLFPQVGAPEIEYRWSGKIAVTPDMYPHVHEPQPGLIMALGYCGRGVALATIMGAGVGEYAATGDREALAWPTSDIRTIPFHGARRLYVAAATVWYQAVDALR